MLFLYSHHPFIPSRFSPHFCPSTYPESPSEKSTGFESIIHHTLHHLLYLLHLICMPTNTSQSSSHYPTKGQALNIYLQIKNVLAHNMDLLVRPPLDRTVWLLCPSGSRQLPPRRNEPQSGATMPQMQKGDRSADL